MLELSIDINGLSDSLDRLSRGLERELHEALNRTLLQMQGIAKNGAPVDTGFLRASIFPVSATLNGYAMAVAAATAREASRSFALSIPIPKGKLEGFLVAGAEYAIYVEYGAFHRRRNTVRLGNRAGRIGVKLEGGGFATYTPGYLFMTEALDRGRPILKREALEGFRRAKMKAGFAV
ncbi:putative tail component [Caudoviricetes sp.]|nr:putative tail component [Caudoviricetes sp.]